jgi:hypothetical protein
VGPEIGEALTKRFPTAIALYKALDDCKESAERRGGSGQAACVQLLSEVQVNLSRKVGLAAATSVYQQLFQINWHAVSS